LFRCRKAGSLAGEGIMTIATRLAATYIALAAMLLSALLPAGWMPNGAGGKAGGPPIVLCTANGQIQITFDSNGQPHKKAPDKGNSAHHDGVCPFAGAPHLASAPVVVATAAPGLIETVWRPQTFAEAPIAAPLPPQHSPRAPPHLT
jgi:hypothetical protein